MRDPKYKVFVEYTGRTEVVFGITFSVMRKVNRIFVSHAEYIIRDDRDKFHLREYIGLKDKNGVEIYEGDIVREGSSELMVIVYDEHQCKYKACPISVYNINAGNGGYTGYRVSLHSEIIGNIYENPELLDQ